MIDDSLTVTFVANDGSEESFIVREGMTVLDIARKYDINIEGACEGSLVCSTCHIIVDDDSSFKKLCAAQPISDAEADMLDLAPYLTDRSRLGCQIVMNKSLDGLRLRLPKNTRNIRIQPNA